METWWTWATLSRIKSPPGAESANFEKELCWRWFRAPGPVFKKRISIQTSVESGETSPPSKMAAMRFWNESQTMESPRNCWIIPPVAHILDPVARYVLVSAGIAIVTRIGTRASVSPSSGRDGQLGPFLSQEAPGILWRCSGDSRGGWTTTIMHDDGSAVWRPTSQRQLINNLGLLQV